MNKKKVIITINYKRFLSVLTLHSLKGLSRQP